MAYEVEFADEFGAWWDGLTIEEQESVAFSVRKLQDEGVNLKRPHADTVKGSAYPNMRELRVQHQGRPYRVLYAFDPRRVALLLIGGDKTGNMPGTGSSSLRPMQSTPLTFARFSGRDRHTTRKPSFQRSEDMARNFKELYDKMPRASRERVEERVKEFHHALALDDIRRARKLTQVEVAAKLGVDQGAVSKIEKRSDVYVSTLRQQIETIGGSLELRAVVPDV